VRAARTKALDESRPVLIEAMTYRGGHHSTSDDSSRYRPQSEIDRWQARNTPLARMRALLTARGAWSDAQNQEYRARVRDEVLQAMLNAEKRPKPPISELFTDVYSDLPASLAEQQQDLKEHLAAYGQEYRLDEFAPEGSSSGKHE